MTDSTTATEAMMREKTNRDDTILRRQFEHFVRKWSRQIDRRGEFEADLYMLVRAIHADAAKPYEITMRQMMEMLPAVRFAPMPAAAENRRFDDG